MQKETIIQGILMCLFYLEYLCLCLASMYYEPKPAGIAGL